MKFKLPSGEIASESVSMRLTLMRSFPLPQFSLSFQSPTESDRGSSKIKNVGTRSAFGKSLVSCMTCCNSAAFTVKVTIIRQSALILVLPDNKSGDALGNGDELKHVVLIT